MSYMLSRFPTSNRKPQVPIDGAVPLVERDVQKLSVRVGIAVPVWYATFIVLVMQNDKYDKNSIKALHRHMFPVRWCTVPTLKDKALLVSFSTRMHGKSVAATRDWRTYAEHSHDQWHRALYATWRKSSNKLVSWYFYQVERCSLLSLQLERRCYGGCGSNMSMAVVNVVYTLSVRPFAKCNSSVTLKRYRGTLTTFVIPGCNAPFSRTRFLCWKIFSEAFKGVTENFYRLTADQPFFLQRRTTCIF